MHNKNIVAVIATATSVACANSEPANGYAPTGESTEQHAPMQPGVREDDPAVSARFVADLNGTQMPGFQPATLNVTFEDGQHGWADLSWATGEDDASASMVVTAPLTLLRVGDVVDVTVLRGPLSRDSASGNLSVGGVLVDDGEARITLEPDRRVIGTVEHVNLTFAGEFVLGCFVPPDTLAPNAPVPVNVETGRPSLVMDGEFKSLPCAEAKAALE